MSINSNYKLSIANQPKVDRDGDNDGGKESSFKSLGKALSSGNLTQSQNIFRQIADQARLANPPKKYSATQQEAFKQGFENLGTALGKNNLVEAQKAFQSLHATNPTTSPNTPGISGNCATFMNPPIPGPVGDRIKSGESSTLNVSA